jgi:aminopeptidase N
VRHLPLRCAVVRAAGVALGIALLAACAAPEPPPAITTTGVVRDIHSYARPGEVRVTHLELEWQVAFDRKALDGAATLHLERGPAGRGAPLRLDTRDLDIVAVSAGVAGDGNPPGHVPWRLAEPDPYLGSEFVVELPPRFDRVRIEYRTGPEASGLQWLDGQQTAGGRHPFLYTQSQAIHARSWIPCQDSPGVRVTFDARIRVPTPLRAVMAARDVTRADGEPAVENGHRTYAYSMPHPIPSYLIALAVGELTFGGVGPRTGVWAEPSVLPRAVREFADMERMLEVTEAIYGPYRWERYDLLVLPPSFPFGGMENPMLTFATPTILAGDRSLVSLVAHELAHSWSGNLVTNATWSDFWLNEGFTTYIERRIMEGVYGEERAGMEWTLGRQDLDSEMEGLKDKPGDQVLRIDLTGRDPDDGMPGVPYEKGALMLRQLEETYGRETFDPFLRSWFDQHAFTSVTTDQFTRYFTAGLLEGKKPLPDRSPPDLGAWIDKPGIPSTAPAIPSDLLARVGESAGRWVAGDLAAADIDTTGWTTQQWLHFLRTLPDDLPGGLMAALDAAFGLTRTGNAEIADQWLILAVRHGYDPAYGRLAEFLTTQGRHKYLPSTRSSAGREAAAGLDEGRNALKSAVNRRVEGSNPVWGVVGHRKLRGAKLQDLARMG